MDLYKKVNDTIENVFNLSNVYLSFRYRIIRQLSIGLSYSSRQNVIYYETYKDFVERLLEKEALQGWRFRITARPVKYLSLGVNTGMWTTCTINLRRDWHKMSSKPTFTGRSIENCHFPYTMKAHWKTRSPITAFI
jgi:hypothetical protein